MRLVRFLIALCTTLVVCSLALAQEPLHPADSTQRRVATASLTARAPKVGLQRVDYSVLKHLQQGRTPAANRAMVAVSNTFVLAPVPALTFAVGSLCSGSGSTSPLGNGAGAPPALHSSVALAICAATTMGLKAVVKRPRPWVAYDGDLVCLQHVASHSFPSGHTSFTFAAATSLALTFPRWYCWLPAYLWAGAVGFSRLYIGAHYPSDVLVGALIGVGSALLSYHLCSKLYSKSDAVAAPVAACPMVCIGFSL